MATIAQHFIAGHIQGDEGLFGRENGEVFGSFVSLLGFFLWNFAFVTFGRDRKSLGPHTWIGLDTLL